MRPIGNLPDEPQARAFSDFLLSQSVHNEIERDGDRGWSVWVHDENLVTPAQAWLERFRRDPGADEFRGVAAGAARVRDAEAKEEAEYQRRLRTRSQVFPSMRGYGAGLVTYALIVACVVVGMMSRLGRDESFLRPLFMSEGTGLGYLPEVRAGEWWRLFTPILIHFGPAHLLFNMLWLFQLGSLIESRQGHVYFAFLTLGLAVGSNLAQYSFGGPGFGGMSGVVYGLFGYAWIRGRIDPASGLFMDRQTVLLMIIWFFVCAVGFVGHVANFAHGGGLVLGALCGLVSGLVGRRLR